MLDAKGDFGVVVPEVGSPGNLLIRTLPPRARVKPGQSVVTAGTRSSRYQSLFPPEHPDRPDHLRVSPDDIVLSQQAHLAPIVDLHRLDFVQILTRREPGLVAQR